MEEDPNLVTKVGVGCFFGLVSLFKVDIVYFDRGVDISVVVLGCRLPVLVSVAWLDRGEAGDVMPNPGATLL